MSSISNSQPIVIAYDGSPIAKHAIEAAATLLDTEPEVLVLTVWQPFDVAFEPPEPLTLDAEQINEVRRAAEKTAAIGANLAQAAGFDRAEGLAVEAAPTWRAIIDAADGRDARLIVLGSHGRRSLAGALVGSVAGAVAAHSRRPALIVNRDS